MPGLPDIRFPKPSITVLPWPDPVLDRVGHDPRSAYVERFWLANLGPASTWFLRLVAHEFDEHPDGFVMDTVEVARTLGVGMKGGAESPFIRTIDRVIAFGFASYVDDDTLMVHRRMPPLNRRQTNRLPRRLQTELEQWNERTRATPSADEMRGRARALALSLLELGEDLDCTERQLHRWKFHPAIAHEAARWAEGEHARRRAEPDAGGGRPSSIGISGDAA